MPNIASTLHFVSSNSLPLPFVSQIAATDMTYAQLEEPVVTNPENYFRGSNPIIDLYNIGPAVAN